MSWVEALKKEADRAIKECDSLCEQRKEVTYKIARIEREIAMLENLMEFLRSENESGQADK